MDSLYLKIEISKALQDKKETISYFILKDDLYGIRVSKAMGNNLENDDEVVMRNIFKNEDDAKRLIDSLVENGTDFSQIEYVVEDYKKIANSIA